MRKSDRLFQLTNVLRSHQPISAKRLAVKLMVSERTIYRYIDDLSVSGVPVYGEPGVGYRLSEGFELPPLNLSPNELEALITGVNFVASLTGESLAASANSLLSKIEASLPNRSKTEKPELGGAESVHDSQISHRDNRIIRIPVSYRDSDIYRLWQTAHSAIELKCWLRITYKSLAGDTTERRVFPLGLFYWGGKWTLGCWCELRSEYRDFRVDRILEMESFEYMGTLPDGISLQAYMDIQQQK